MTAIQGALAVLLRSYQSWGFRYPVLAARIFRLAGPSPSPMPISCWKGCGQFFLPAQLALIKDMVQAAKQDQAIEMTQAIQGLAVVWPPVAAGLVFGLGIQWALLLKSGDIRALLVSGRPWGEVPYHRSVAWNRGRQATSPASWPAGCAMCSVHSILRTVLIAEVLTWLGFGALESLRVLLHHREFRRPARRLWLARRGLWPRRNRWWRVRRDLRQAHRSGAHPVGRANHVGHLRRGHVAPDEPPAGAGGGVPLRGLGDGTSSRRDRWPSMRPRRNSSGASPL